MRKETVNTFTEGLNFDLHPLTTPNNILTDCVNGTFVTFNGDEFSLQNDAGNNLISITYPQATLYNAGSYNNKDIVYTEENNIRHYYQNISGILGDTESLTTLTSWVELPTGDVKLNPGFLPIGLKEFGGVLYIISAKKPALSAIPFVNGALHTENLVYYTAIGGEIGGINEYGYYRCLISNRDNSFPTSNSIYWEATVVPELFTSGVLHFENHAYYQILNGETSYYKCKIKNSDDFLPIESNSNWDYIGLEKDFMNYYGMVEFGSYPSPEYAGNTLWPGIIVNEDDSNIDDLVYKIVSINLTQFKNGDYIKFDEALIPDHSYISSINNTTYSPKFYRIKLLHQLQNGNIDITSDVWNRYLEFKNGSLQESDFWFNDPNFEYYCPNKYKGTLAILTEIEELSKFEVYEFPNVTYEGGNHVLNLSIDAVGIGSIDIGGVVVQVLDEAGIEITISIVNTLTDGFYVFDIVLPNVVPNQLVYYKITPLISVNSVDITADMPQEYMSKYILRGSVIVNLSASNIKFEIIDLNNYTCLPDKGYKVYNEIALKNSSGQYLDESLEVTATPHVYLYKGETLTSGYHKLGEFYISNNNIIISTPSNILDLDTRLKYFKGAITPETTCGAYTLIVQLYSNDPVEDVDTLLVPITEYIRIEQLGITSYPIRTTGLIGAYFYVVADVDFTIYVEDPNYNNISQVAYYKPAIGTIFDSSTNKAIGGRVAMDVLGLHLSQYPILKLEMFDKDTYLESGNVINFNFSVDININNLKLYQNGILLPIFEKTKREYFTNAISTSSISLYLNEPGFKTINYTAVITSKNTFSIGLIADVINKTEEDAIAVTSPEGVITYIPKRVIYIAWRPTTHYVGEGVEFSHVAPSGYPTMSILVWGDLYDIGGFEQVIEYPYDSPVVTSFTVENLSDLLNGGYDNILDESSYAVKDYTDEGIVIFEKEIPANF